MNECINETNNYVNSLCDDIKRNYTIDKNLLSSSLVKRGLRNDDGSGVMAGITNIGSVLGYYLQDGERIPREGKLYYRGISVEDLIMSHSKDNTFGFEETAYLLLIGNLPTKDQLESFKKVLAEARHLPKNFTEDMIIKAPCSDVMNKLARSVLALYSYDDNPDEVSVQNIIRQCIELIARFPVIVANAYAVKRHAFDGKSLNIHVPRNDLSISENFLRMARSNKSYTDEEAKLLDLMLILHAEHGGGNNSAFVCRVLSSSGTDTYGAVSGAVNSLKGPLHGGANAKVLAMLNFLDENVKNKDDDEEISSWLNKILDGQCFDGAKKIYGLGHAVYTMSDPRAVLLKSHAGKMAKEKGMYDRFLLLKKVEELGIPIIMERKGKNISVCANVDLYSGLVYEMLGIPQELFTPLFATARITGWCAHRVEEALTCGRIIRPAYKAAHPPIDYIPIENR